MRIEVDHRTGAVTEILNDDWPADAVTPADVAAYARDLLAAGLVDDLPGAEPGGTIDCSTDTITELERYGEASPPLFPRTFIRRDGREWTIADPYDAQRYANAIAAYRLAIRTTETDTNRALKADPDYDISQGWPPNTFSTYLDLDAENPAMRGHRVG